MKWWTLSVIALLVAPASGEAPQAAPTAIPAAAAKALSQCLVADATPGYLPEDARVHVRKAVVLAALAARLDADNARAWRVRAEALDVLGDFKGAAEAEARHLRLTGGRGYQSGTRWIRYSLATLDTAELRMAMLSALADDTGRAKPLRAIALVNVAVITEGRGQLDEATALYRRALELDPIQDSALRSLERLSEDPSPLQRLRLAIGLLRGNPLAVNMAWEIGQICRDLGLYDEALVMYDYAQSVARKTGQIPSDVFSHDLLDCLLDAGQFRRAAEQYTEVIAPGVTDLPVAGMLVEASRALGDDQQAAAHIGLMREAYRPQEAVAMTKGAIAAEVAWFNLHYRRRLRLAENWSVLALKSLPDDPFAQRVWAITHLGGAEADKARTMLADLRGSDLYALAALIDDAFTRGDAAGAKAYLAETDAFGRRGPAWRYLRDVVRLRGAALPAPSTDQKQVASIVAELIKSPTLAMGREPEKFIAVTVKPVAAEIRPGHSPTVAVTMVNLSDSPVPVGAWGLFTPKLTLNVQMAMPGEGEQVSQQVPVVWEAPRYLAAGESLTRTVMLDTGAIGKAMAYRPLGLMELTIEAMADPVERDGEWVSGIPSIVIAPARIVRKPLVGAETPEAYYEALKALVRQFTGDDQVEAMRAADVTVSLLHLVEKVKAGQTAPAGKLGRGLREPELLSMLRYCLQQAPPAVRARTLGSMGRLTPTPLMLRLMGPSLVHSSSLIRARAVEVLGAAATGQSTRTLVRLAEKDPDPLVRGMAKAILSGKKPQP